MKKTIIILLVAIFCVSCLSIGTYAYDRIKDPIAAGDVCEMHLRQNCEICNGISTHTISIYECPRCGNDLSSYCSGSYYSTYNEVDCFLKREHPSGCSTIQSLCYTDKGCTDYKTCRYYVSGVTPKETHIQAYYHSLVPSCKDDCYCSLSVYPDKPDR